jgi:hypothetical protein
MTQTSLLRIQGIWRVWIVNIYLLLIYSWLCFRGRLPNIGVHQWVSAIFRPRRSYDLLGFRPEIGHCYLAASDPSLLSDKDSVSAYVLLEDGVPLEHPHAPHEEVRTHGAGRYSHWGDCVYFSASDNSDPQTNGRSYQLREVLF